MRRAPMEFALNQDIPDAFLFEDLHKVVSYEDWQKRAEELKKIFEYYMYGPLPDMTCERISYTLGEWYEQKKRIELPAESGEIVVTIRTANVRIEVECEGRKSGFDVILCVPSIAPKEGKYPVYVEMSFVWGDRKLEPTINDFYAASRGYATICYNPIEVAEDKNGRKGAFYTVHPYEEEWNKQTGVLAAWGWGASKILDVLKWGLAEECNIDSDKNILSGVSRFGKATLVAGAYDKRIKVVVPACSGAGGAAMYRYVSEGNTYDLAELGYVTESGCSMYTFSQNEALDNLQSEAERHWFNDIFLEFDCASRLPVDQHELAALIAAKDRYLFMISAATQEDWVNAPAMGKAYLETGKIFDFLGIRSHVCLCEHLKGHAITINDMEKLLDYCDAVFYSGEEEVGKQAARWQKSIFWNSDSTSRQIKM